jgi:peroxiredoxin Q/BCP
LSAGTLAQGPRSPVPTSCGGHGADSRCLDRREDPGSDYRGKTAVVVAWFPRAFTGGCTIECKSLADNGEKIRKYQVVYFMASTDTIEENTKFAKATTVTLAGRGGAAPTIVEKKEADFPMLSDPGLAVARAYGVVDGQRTAASRWTFYIDKAGKIAAIDTAVRPASSAEDMIAKLDALKVPVN